MFWSTGRLVRLCGALLIALSLAAVVLWISDKTRESGLKRGDFPAFYTPVVVLDRGMQAADLYSANIQRDIQNELWPELDGGYHAFIYPPYVAFFLYATLVKSAPDTAKLQFLFYMFVALYFAVRLAQDLRGGDKRNLLLLLSSALLCGPILNGTIGGQNVALSMLLFMLVVHCLVHPERTDERAAGCYAGLWLFKPHFAVFLLFFLLLAGKTRVIFWSLIPAGIYFVIGVLVSGWTWPLEWLEHVQKFAELDATANQHNMVSFLGIGDALAVTLNLPQIPLKVVSLAAAALVLLLTAKQFWSLRSEHDPARLQHALLLSAPAIVLISPHTLYYDLGLCLLPCAHYLRLDSDRKVWLAMLTLAALFALTMSRELFPVQPMFLVALASFIWIYKQR